jgi:predicted transcriptional regulator of viral defense system
MNATKAKLLKQVFKPQTIMTSQELEASGLNRSDIQVAVQQQFIEKVATGLYRGANAAVSENHSLVIAAKALPQGVACLLTALRFYEITTQSPHEVWMALPRGRTRTRLAGVRLVQYDPATLKTGIEQHKIEGVFVKVTSPARTVADCFKFRNKIGLDVAIEALREGKAGRHFTNDELMRQARICRVEKILRPYLEAMT